MAKRKEYGYKGSKSAENSYTTTINSRISKKLAQYCSTRGINRSVYVNQVLEEALNEDYQQLLMSLSNEDLVALVLNSK